LLRKRHAGLVESLPFHHTHLSAFTALIPQAVSPFEKFSPGDWYMATYYPEAYARGLGLGFGAIAESVIGLGWIDLAWRAVVLGVAFGLIHRWRVHSKTFWADAFYLWLTVWAYWAFRDATFSLLYIGLHRWVLVWAVVAAVLRITGPGVVRGSKSQSPLPASPAAAPSRS
jgi:hypothetical protein